jgi:CDP-diacylglycerol--serine O-phosphatidyltransferase
MTGPRRHLSMLRSYTAADAFTIGNAACGTIAIFLCLDYLADDNRRFLWTASLLLPLALVCDVLDGHVARLDKRRQSFLGADLDSLADVISFGVAPSLLVYKWSLFQKGTFGLVVAFTFAAAGAVRLARFNVLSMNESGKPTKPGKYILGLPVPGAAGILISLVVANHAVGGDLPKYVYPLMGLTGFLAFLMVSTIRFRSFKDLRLNARSVGLVLFAVVSSAIVSLQTKPAFVLVWLLGFYVVIGLVETLITVPREVVERRRRRRLGIPDKAPTSERPSLPPP